MKRLLIYLVLSSNMIFGADLAPDHKQVIASVDARAKAFQDVSKQIWQFAEVGYKETKSSALLQKQLSEAGFKIESGVAEMPTAFIASYGQGAPVIAILGEFDALPGLSQDAMPDRKPVTANAPGHGCGHNLLGTGAALAAISVKDYIEKNKIAGTIRFYGTPAEEGGSGKVYMIRAGLFKDVDAVLHWHPGDSNNVINGGFIAMVSAKVQFHGVATHAAAAPERGRSALDGLMIMDTSLEYLREHIPSSARIHYIITKGGVAPNIVPDFAEGFLYARHPSMATLNGIWDRVLKCAEAGALASGTTMNYQIVNSDFELLSNNSLADQVFKNFQEVGPTRYDPEQTKFATELSRSFGSGASYQPGREATIRPLTDAGTTASGGSSDVGDVSWVVPTIGISTATWAPGTVAHSWQATACSGSKLGQDAMVVAAKVLAISAQDLFTKPELVKAARDEFNSKVKGQQYESKIPAGQKPPLNYRDVQ